MSARAYETRHVLSPSFSSLYFPCCNILKTSCSAAKASTGVT